MYSYQLVQWLLFFYIYCFFGWVWESCYVSFHKKKWVNRGFMHGPFLPIYGFGAITVLVTTIPVKDNLLLVFLFGMTGATVLEYFTGALMEKMFHVRYWDYSSKKFNLDGHICLSSSLAWGGFSILMTHVIHCPIEAVVLAISSQMTQAVTYVLTVAIVIDFTQSFNEAMDLKELLENLTESNEEIQRIRKRVDVVVAILDSDRKELVQKVYDGKQTIEDKVDVIKDKYAQFRENHEQTGEAKRLDGAQEKLSVNHIIHRNLEQSRQDKSRTLANLSEKLNSYIDTIRTTVTKENCAEEVEKVRAELEEFKESVKKQTAKLHSRSEKAFDCSLKMLRRNPDAVSKKYSDALKEVQDLERR